MSEKTGIRWTDATWNPMSGCTEVSPGCDHCYAKTFAEKMRGSAGYPVGFDPMLRPKALDNPRKWKEPRRIFVNSMSDVFHKAFPQDYIDQVFRVMLEVPRHDYLILTKRPERMAHYIKGWLDRNDLTTVPPFIWLGTSIEADKFTYRADILRTIPVGIRFISAEPLLEPLPSLNLKGLAWVIVGGESGPGFRPMDHEWARDLRDRCAAAGVAYFFKQSSGPRTEMGVTLDGRRHEEYPDRPEAPALIASKPTLGQIGLPI